MQQTQGVQDWIALPSGVAVEARYFSRDMEDVTLFRLNDPAFVDAFNHLNREAGTSGVRPLQLTDHPMDRLARYAALLSHGDGSFLPSADEFVSTALEAAAGKDREPHRSAYAVLAHSPYWLATRDVVAFRELLRAGPHKGAYVADLYQYGKDDGLLSKVAERILVPGRSGWTTTLGRHGLPLDIAAPARIAGIEYQVEDMDAKGYFFPGDPPKQGDQRLALRGPACRGGRPLDTYLGGGRDSSGKGVAALRFRPAQKAA